MTPTQSPLRDLNKAHSVLNSCTNEPQLDAAVSFFELVMQKWNQLLSSESARAFQQEFFSKYRNKKEILKLE